MKKNLYILILLFGTLAVMGQDYHLSHYDITSLYFNPATTGYIPADYRVTLDQRSQWRAMGMKPFSTSYLSYDAPYKIKDRTVGLGAYLVDNNAGFGNFNTLSLMFSGAYDIINGHNRALTYTKRQKHILTVGLQAGLFYRSTNADNLTYDAQYSSNSGTFEESLPSNESYNKLSIVRFDAAYGLYYKMVDKYKKFRPSAGFSMAHLTRPLESLTGGNGRLAVRWMGNVGIECDVNDKITLTPRALYMNQAKAMELMIGSMVSYQLNENESRLIASVDWRRKDAWVVGVGVLTKGYSVRFSYDINTSYLGAYTNRRGAFEISLVYFGRKGQPFMQALSQF